MSPEVPIIILILAVPSYFVCSWVIRKFKIGHERNRRQIAIISALLLSPFVYVSLIIIWVFSASYYTSNDFDKTEWDSNVEERYRMAEDIIDNKMLIGKTRSDVIQILGSKYSNNNEDYLSYELGIKPGLFNIDPDYLYIKFKNEIVLSVNQSGN
ncbi:hypothetical protein SAMN04487891_11528 [Flagellimonas taeanensis]|uniref:Uncharacterized protein n=1 Tax=Flagellimonas taeanensis TaxID=1005926 RepID=A0A1M7C9P8_9FLAO|nr:hypothetical protein [Allomuricauda taeanensis]SFC61375.1 hypothetical protein SAMN04487891_11528 [Allomuricauda taeanensis]SHL64012.1 hypothetical protein SAMN05216293_3958 [Allomuricauda taeanensis]